MCKADNDVWYRPAIKPDGTKYYEYILVYTDDILCLSMDPKSTQYWVCGPVSRNSRSVFQSFQLGLVLVNPMDPLFSSSDTDRGSSSPLSLPLLEVQRSVEASSSLVL